MFLGYLNWMYATNEEAEKDKSKFIFNCYQRAHQVQPIKSSSRVAYAKGYQTGDPVKRGRGRFGLIGTLGLLVTCILT
ncbi:8193_t:CDS:2, partial [Entrophospora sp. SA101]